MRFGSVEFFKVLIKTVLAVAFFVPLVLCVIFIVAFVNKSGELEQLKNENERLAFAAEVLIGERAPDVESFYELYSRSGLSDEELIAYISAQSGDSQASEPSQASVGETEAPKDTATEAAAETADTTADSHETTEAAETSESAEVQSEYADIYPDMMVDAPTEYVREEGTVYLTFDDGPSDHTYSILAYLKEYNVKATFFVVPQRTEWCYEMLRAIVADGHSIGVHSASHDYETIYSSVDAFLEDFHEAWDIIYEATGVKTQIFRFPGGSVNDFNEETRDAIIEEMTRRGFRYFDWNVDSNDAGGANWTQMYNSIPADIAQNYRSVVLMHDSVTTENTVWVLEDILNLLKTEGYKLDKINDDTLPIQFVGPYA